MTQKVKKMTRSRSGKAPPPVMVSGRASVDASDTPPRIPVQATISAVRQEGGGSRKARNLAGRHEGKAAGTNHPMRTTMTPQEVKSSTQKRGNGALPPDAV